MTVVKVTITKGEKKWIAYFNEQGLMESLAESNLFTSELVDAKTGKRTIFLDDIKHELNDNSSN